MGKKILALFISFFLNDKKSAHSLIIA